MRQMHSSVHALQSWLDRSPPGVNSDMPGFDNRIKLSRNWSLSKDRLFQITSFVVYRGLFEFILGRFKPYFDVLHCFGDKLVDFLFKFR